MYSPRKKLFTPKEYDFPYMPPYDIQQNLMEELYAVLESKRIGIFESPTGTGKSLTLTCAALRWLEDHEQLVRADLTERLAEVQQEILELTAKANQTDDWITAQYAAQKQREDLHELQALSKSLAEHEQRLKDLLERQVKQRKERISEFKRKKEKEAQHSSNVEESSTDCGDSVDGKWEEEEHGFSADGKIEDNDTFEVSNAAEERYRDVKIFFCSRTHTQLSQVVREVKRTAYGKRIRCVSLASRQQLCINPAVKRLSNVSLINERCLDMSRSTGTIGGKNKSQTSCNCSFRSTTAVQQLSDTISTDIHDIEDLVTEGETIRACPYYAARRSVATAQLIMLPYQMLLHRRTRLQSGIDLRGAIVIIDEAHNLLDTIAQMHSCELTLQQLQATQQQITAYKIRYAKHFSSTNLLRINQLLFVTKRLAKLLLPPSDTKASNTRMLRTYELTAEGEFFNIDLFQLLEFCERTRFAQKLQGFIAHQAQEPSPSENKPPQVATTAATGLLQRMQQQHEQESRKQTKKSKLLPAANIDENQKKQTSMATATVSSIRPLLAFIEALTENAEDGRVLLNIINEITEVARSSYKYILLNPSGHFEDIVRDARAIIIAGGTMQPTAELTEQLFRYCADRVELHFYDHVVPAEAVLPFVVAKGPNNGSAMCFNYASRGSNEMLTELGMFLQNICNVIPAGVVCFLPSYDYLDLAYAHLKRIGVCERISTKKRIFCETRSGATGGQTVEKLLADYAAAIGSSSGGALLFSVVGGKLSEGLNFADDLGRAVIVVGMPYPNRHAPELKQRMVYLDSTLGVGAGNEYYENLCMKAVNQCIGRSVRHINDYACVFLLDERYASERIQKKLPQWILRSLRIPSTFGLIQATTAKFFKERRLLALGNVN